MASCVWWAPWASWHRGSRMAKARSRGGRGGAEVALCVSAGDAVPSLTRQGERKRELKQLPC